MNGKSSEEVKKLFSGCGKSIDVDYFNGVRVIIGGDINLEKIFEIAKKF